MKSDQVDVVSAAVFRRLEQVLHAAEAGLSCEVASDTHEPNRLDRIYDNVSLVHAVTTARLNVGPRPDANAARDPPASDSFAKPFSEDHGVRRSVIPFASGRMGVE
jgi:hypothetical protein